MRTPQGNIEDLERQIGARPAYVTSANRGLVQNWLVAKGVPSVTVKRMKLNTLAKAYNHERYLAAILANSYIPHQDPEPAQEQQPETPHEEIEDMEPMPAPVTNGHDITNGHDKSAAAQKLAEALAMLAPEARLDETRVIELIREHAPQARELIVRQSPDAAPVKVAGRVHPCFDRVVKLLAQGANVLLVGPAGCGKTHLAEQVAQALQLTYGAIHGSAGASESALTGWLLPSDGGRFEYVAAPFVELYEQGNSLFLFDELDAFDPNMLLTVNGALANGHMHIAHRRGNPVVQRGANMRVIATANTFGTGANPVYAGRSPLDGATLDRFITITVDYDKELESDIGTVGGLSATEMADIWRLRDKVRETQLRRIISTRAFQKAAMMKAAGDEWSTVMSTLVEGWTRDERSKVGM